MATEQSPSVLESTSRKRQRRLRQDPQFIFENPTTNEIEMDTTPKSNKQKSIQIKTRSVHSVDDNSIGADLYEPGDIVWSKLGSFPWWPALIYRCNAEGGIYTKTFNSNNKTKRQFFVYFYGKYLEYAWLSTRSLLKYAGLNTFIQNAETAVRQASTKSEKLELANRYQLKVSMKKRIQWDEAIELADKALTMTKDERIKQFSDLLDDVKVDKKKLKNDEIRRKVSIDKNNDLKTKSNKHPKRIRSLSSSLSSELPDQINTVEKISQPSIEIQNEIIQSNNNINMNEEPMKKKRGRKSKSTLTINEQDNKTLNSSISNNNNTYSIRSRLNQSISTSNEKEISSLLTNTKKLNNDNEIEYEYVPTTHDQQTSYPFIYFSYANIPPLSNYEQKQIVENILNYNKEKILTLDEARLFAMNKAIEIVYENHNYRMDNISSEWFYDSILLKYPSIVFKYRSWFDHVKPDIIPDGTDIIKLKQWQIALMIQAQIKAEQRQQLTNEKLN
ncbi:unnamed protein product [Rotaria sp. Silwood1]|nr:unnamed protein product [Rotaria sp. Silwood1]